MPTPPDVHEAITDARSMPDGTWSARWKYPDPEGDKARDVWETLKPARDYLERTTGEFFTPKVGETARSIVARISERIMDHAIGAKSSRQIPGTKI